MSTTATLIRCWACRCVSMAGRARTSRTSSRPASRVIPSWSKITATAAPRGRAAVAAARWHNVRTRNAMKLSIIIPPLDEADVITATLAPLQSLRRAGHEVVLDDGGSRDAATTLAAPLVDKLLSAPRGRARQMNAGAGAASGDWLLFLLADTLLPAHADEIMAGALADTQRRWGRFDVRLSGVQAPLRVIEATMNLRSRVLGFVSGVLVFFVVCVLFVCVGGFFDLALMEDIALSRMRKRHGPPLCLRARVVTSSRRWESRGVVRTVLLMWCLRLAYFFGADPQRLVRRYYAERP